MHLKASRYLVVPLFLLCTAIARGADLPPPPLQQETLANGLRVIYTPVHQMPIVHVRMLYHVGSRDENPQRQGFAHMFEHMMFRGSAHVGEQDFVRLIRSAGGVFNGQTDQDITSYFETLPKNQLPLALYLEADRMAGIKVTPEVFRIERNVVLEEISLRFENPFIAMRDELLGELFGSGSYRWSALGNPQHLAAADVAELRTFFDRYYVPNNAVLVIAGDFDPESARHLVHEYFEWIPRGPDIQRRFVAQPAQTAPRRIEINRPASNVMLMAGCQTPGYGSDDEAALIVLEQAIKARVLQNLTLEENHLASATFAQALRLEDDGCLCFGATLLEGADISRAERILSIRLQLLRDEGIIASEAQFKALTDAICAELIRLRQTFDGFSDQVGRGAIFRDQPDATDRLITRLRALTAPMVRVAAEKYLKPEALTLMIIRPQPAPTTQAAAGNTDGVTTRPLENAREPIAFPADYPARAPFGAPMLPAPVKSISEIHVHGLTALLVNEPRAPGVDWRFLFPRGSQSDPPDKRGLGALTAAMLVGTLAKPPLAMTWQQNTDTTTITAGMPSAAIETAMNDLGAVLRQPLLAVADDGIFVLKWRLFNEIRSRSEQPTPVLEMESLAALFANSPLSRNITAASLRAISRQDVDAYRRRLFDPRGAVVTLHGNITTERAQALLEKLFEGWTTEAPATEPADDAAVSVATSQRSRPRIILIDSPESHESFIRVGSAALGRDNSERPIAALAGLVLSQRMFQTVRADKGYAYAIDSEFRLSHGVGMFAAQTATSVARTGTTVAALLSNIQQLAGQGPNQQELDDARSSHFGMGVLQLNSPLQQMTWRAQALLHGDVDDLAGRLDRTAAVTPSDVRQLFAVYGQPGQMVVVIVAPVALVPSDLEPLGDVEIRPMPNRRPGAATRPAYEEIPRPMM